MPWKKALLFIGGAAAASIVNVASKSQAAHNAAVAITAKALDANDALQATTQSIMDEADDVRAEAERQRKIDAAVAARLAELEEGIREEVVAEVDGTKKSSSHTTKAKK